MPRGASRGASTFVLLLLLLLQMLLAASVPAPAASINIVAIGASNTYGSGRGKHAGGVSSNQAYPAQLQSMLRAKGHDVHVTNAGVAGDTTAGMLSRLEGTLSSNTRLVIIQPGGNDARRGGSAANAACNVAAMQRILAARGIKVIVLRHILSMVPARSRDPDGEHFDARGHAAVAARLYPQVVAAVRQR
jgi:acyl-CoA thioesterase I